jgi:hypothetical protein
MIRYLYVVWYQQVRSYTDNAPLIIMYWCGRIAVEVEMESPRETAIRSEVHYPEYASVVQDLQSKERRYITLRALAESATDTDDALHYDALADTMLAETPGLAAIPYLAESVVQLADLYRP